MADPTSPDLLALRALLDAAPARPWLYRPDRFDDWGFIRGGAPTEYGLPVVALGRSGGIDGDHDAHRAAGTDPYGPASALIVEAVNALPALLDAIEALQKERDEARGIVRDIHWMAQRYADGRMSYAPGHYNDAIEKAREWLPDIQHARDGMSAEYRSIQDQLATAQATIGRLREVLERISTCRIHACDGPRGEPVIGWDFDPRDAARAALADDGEGKDG